MTTLSSRTLGLLIQVGVNALTRSDLTTMLMRAGLDDYGFRETNKQEVARSRLRGAREEAQQGDSDAHRALLRFVELMVRRLVADPEEPPEWFGELCEDLHTDGFPLTWSRTVEEPDDSRFFEGSAQVLVRYKITVADPAPVPLETQITALEAALEDRGYTLPLRHYRQAIDGLRNHKHESSNGDLRTTLEALVVQLAKDHTGFIGQGRANEGYIAIEHMVIKTKALPERDGGRMLQGLWSMIHTNGSHPGQSTADEARIRMQLVTATARFLLNHFTSDGQVV
ncbi:MAG TPA: hypothetical protein VIQ76_10400 [Propionibacteriaceae bacterium]